LNCQVNRTSGPPPSQPQSQSNKIQPASPQKIVTQDQPSPENKQSDLAKQDKKPTAEAKQPTITPKSNAQKSKGDESPSKPGLSYKVEQNKKESGFFGFGGAQSRPPSPQSAVSEKVLGFGSSFLSSASNLISSAVKDESSTKTPPSSRKGSTVSQSSIKTTPTSPISRKGTPTSPISRKGSEASQASQKNKLAEEAKLTAVQKQDEKMKTVENKPQDKMSKEAVTNVKINEPALELPKACPLCKMDLKRDPPNYNTCTECKNTVCNLCGFNPMPHQNEVRVLFFLHELDIHQLLH